MCNHSSTLKQLSRCVSALMTKGEFITKQGEEFLNETYEGSLPKFIAAFTRKNKLSSKEIEEIQNLINEHKEW